VASRNERKGNVITIWGFGTLLGKRGVNNVQYSERKNWRSIVPAGNLYNKRRGGGVRRESDASYARGRRVNIIYYRNVQTHRGGVRNY
jgi:hypothetical protein